MSKRLSKLTSIMVALAALGGQGCGDDAAPVDGATMDGGTPDAMALDPQAPAPPVLTPCAPGWREETTESPSTCAPWPESGRAECAGVEAHFPGEPGCAPIGTSCPTGDFPDDAPGDAIFVLAGAVDGDGSRGSPYGTINAAVRVATFDSTIIVGAGTYDENLILARRLTLRGVCPERTVITSTLAVGPLATVDVVATEVTIENLSVRDAERAAILGEEGATVHLGSVLLEGNRFAGLGAIGGAHLDVRDLIIRDMRSAADGRFGRGVDIEDGGTAEIRRLAVESARTEAVFVSDEGSELILEDAVLDSTQSQESDDDFGHGLAVQTGASVQARRIVATNNRGTGIAVFFDGSHLVLEDSLIAGTQVYEAGGLSGFGLAVQDGASAEARRVFFADNAEGQVFLQAATLTLEDAVVRDARGRPDGENGRGVQAQNDAMLTIHRVAVQRAREVGLQVTARSVVDGDDVLVTDTVADDEATLGRARGIGVESGSSLSLERVRVAGMREMGVAAFSDGTQVMLTDLEVSEVRRAACVETTCPDSRAGAGVGAYDSGAITAQSFVVRDSDFCGVQVAEDGSLDLSSGVVADSLLGACVQVDGYDLMRINERVEYRDNETSLDSTSLPVPAPIAGLGS